MYFISFGVFAQQFQSMTSTVQTHLQKGLSAFDCPAVFDHRLNLYEDIKLC